jgi:hypothetical protein
MFESVPNWARHLAIAFLAAGLALAGHPRIAGWILVAWGALTASILNRLLRYRLFRAGYPTCCEHHARHCFLVIYDLGDQRETFFRMSLN